MVRKIESDFINNTSVKSHVRNTGFRSSDEFIEELDQKIKTMINNAYYRAKGNGRTTILKRDL